MQFKQSETLYTIKIFFICIQKSENIKKIIFPLLLHILLILFIFILVKFSSVQWTVFQSLFILFKYYLSQGLIYVHLPRLPIFSFSGKMALCFMFSPMRKCT